MTYTAHKTENRTQSVEEHINGVEKLAMEYAAGIGLEYTAQLCAKLHDLGKLCADFDDYINGRNSMKRGEIDHCFAGGKYILEIARKTASGDAKIIYAAELAARVVVSHHGIHDWCDEDGNYYLDYRAGKNDRYAEISAAAARIFPEETAAALLKKSADEITAIRQRTGEIIRMAYQKTKIDNKVLCDNTGFYQGMLERLMESVLVDADRTDTADFMGGKSTSLSYDKEKILDNMSRAVEEKCEEFRKKTDPISKRRMSISDRCKAFAAHDVGICRLIVPTGGGKTISSLRFAIEHARRNKMDRIFYVAPFMSILEQNSAVIRSFMQGDEELFLEHHSDMTAHFEDDSEELREYEIRTEKWDSPVIATTLVQFLNSLFSGEMSCVRRMHRLAKSVIIIDEVQSIPIKCVNLCKTLYDSFIEYNSQNAGKVDLCYALGKELPITYKHPGKIRNAGDKGKLMSTNDESGFTYRGRFKDKEEAASVSYEFSQKAHNALKWLISRQGKAVGSLTVLVWDSCLEGLPSVYDSISFDDLEDFGDMVQTDYVDPNELGASYKDKLSRSICGYRNRLKDSPKAMVMMLDSATTGRVAMVMYTELSTSEFLANLEKWHNETAWIRFNSKKKAQNESSFSLDEIVNSAYGYEDEKNGFLAVKEDIRRDTFRRLIPCVVEGARLPADIMYALIDRASNPLAFSNYFNWQLVLEVTCGMLRKANFDRYREDCGMALDKNCTDRDYLYGRLLAWADMAESSTYDEDDKNKRITNARRYFNAFSNRPYSTWGIIYEKLRPYLDKIQGKNKFYYEKLFDEINDKFTNETYMNNDKLQPEFILAYSCQKNQIYNERQASGSKKNVLDENKED